MALLSDPTFAQLNKDYYATLDARVRRGTLSDSTRDMYERWSRFGAMRWFAGRQVSTITVREVTQMQAAIAADAEHGISPANGAVAQMSRIIEHGIRVGLIADGFNPAAKVKRIEAPTPRRKVIDIDKIPEVAEVLRLSFYEPGRFAIKRLVGGALYALLLTGGRRNEILRAQIPNWDSEQRILTIPNDKSARKRKDPKRLAVCDEVAQLFDDIILCGWHPVWFFPSTCSKMGCLVDASAAWKKALRIVGLDTDIRIHDMRHTLAEVASDTEDLKTVSAMLGHLSTRSTLRYVGESKPERTRRAVQHTVDRMLGKPEPEPAHDILRTLAELVEGARA